MNRSVLISSILAALLLGGSALVAVRVHGSGAHEEEEKKPEARAVPVQVATVHSGTLAETLRLTGTLQPLPNGSSRVAAQVAGRLSSVLVRPGQEVKAGQLLATVSRPELGALARQAGAGVREAERELEALR